MDKVKTLITNTRSSIRRLKLLHISPSGSKWSVRADKVPRARKLCESKEEALNYVKPYQQQGWVLAVHNASGMVEYMIDAYGHRI